MFTHFLEPKITEWIEFLSSTDVYKRQPITWIEEIQTIFREREIKDLWMDKQQWKLTIQSLL